MWVVEDRDRGSNVRETALNTPAIAFNGVLRADFRRGGENPAYNFAVPAKDASVRRVIYLGGLAAAGAPVKSAIDFRIPSDLRQQRSLAGKQHRLGDDVDDFPGECLERLRLTATGQQAGQTVGTSIPSTKLWSGL